MVNEKFLQWKASITGIEDVKRELKEVRADIKSNSGSIVENTQKQAFLGKQLKSTNLSLGQQKSLFLAMHPSLNKLSQAMSIFGQVSRSALSIMNALNLATLATNTSHQALFDLKLQELEILKDIRDIEQDGVTEDEVALLDERKAALREVRAEMENVRKEAQNQDWNNLWTKISAVVEGITTAVGTGLSIAFFTGKLKIEDVTKFFGDIGSKLGDAIMGGLRKAFLPATIVEFLSMMGKQLAGDEDIAQGWEALVEIFSVDIPNALTKLQIQWGLKWELIKKATLRNVNIIIGHFQVLVNSFIRIINTFIEAYNRVAKKLHLGTIGKLGEVKLPTLGEGTATGGTSKAVPFSESQFAGSAGGMITINVAGSILSERELKDLTGAALKERMKRAGYG